MTAPLIPRLQSGIPAALIDGLFSAACYLAAYYFRFGDNAVHFLSESAVALPVMVAGHLSALALVGAYRPAPLWPVRFVSGTTAGVITAFACVVALDGPAGLSRLATGAYLLVLVLAGLSWRATAGLAARWAATRSLSDSGALEPQGAQYGSMAGGLAWAWTYRHLLRNLVVKDLKLKYRGSALGFLWSLVNPVLMIAVYGVAFTHVIRSSTERFPFFLLLGVVAWGFFATSVSGATGAITDGGSLIKSVAFPRVVLPLAGVASNLAQFALTMGVLLPLMLAWYGAPLGAQMLLAPLFLALHVLLIAGLALLLATASAFLRDVKHLVDVALSLLFWATPILYEFRQVQEPVRLAVLLTPMSPFVRAYQDLFFYQIWPDETVWLLAVAYGVCAFICGLSVFVAYEDRLSEQA